MTTAQQVIDILRPEVGYQEGFSGGHWNNMEKYAPEVPGLEWAQGQPWCAVLQSWADHKAGIAGPNTASCLVGVAWFKARNRFSEYPAIGAWVFFGRNGGVHTGRVYNYDDTYVYTIEGNTNVNGSPEGDGVYLKQHARRDSYVYGYGYPEFEEGITSADPAWASQAPAPGGIAAGTVTPPAAPVILPTVRLPHVLAAMAMDSAPSSPTGTVHYGDPAAARALEQALWDVGINCGPVDGSLGTMFQAGWAEYQRRKGFRGQDADGKPGMTTLTMLANETHRYVPSAA